MPATARRIQALNATLSTGDRRQICEAVFRAVLDEGGDTAFALKAGVYRATLYRLSKLDSEFDYFLKIMHGLELKLSIVDEQGSAQSSVARELSFALEIGEIRQIVEALSKVLRAQENVTMFAKRVNRDRIALYRSFTYPQIPRLGTVLSFLNALPSAGRWFRIPSTRVKTGE